MPTTSMDLESGVLILNECSKNMEPDSVSLYWSQK